jgi:hypothetical protein
MLEQYYQWKYEFFLKEERRYGYIVAKTEEEIISNLKKEYELKRKPKNFSAYKIRKIEKE